MIKAVMYHYVRPQGTSKSKLNYLDVLNFEKQLDYFDKTFGIVSSNEWEYFVQHGETKNLNGKVLLTFDDGLRDHLEYVAPLLLKKSYWALFFVCTGQLSNMEGLNVHKVHYLCGSLKINELKNLRNMFDKKITSAFQRLHSHKLLKRPYENQLNSDIIQQLKIEFNYILNPSLAGKVLDEMLDCCGLSFPFSEFYMDKSDIKTLKDYGFEIGAHTVNHYCMRNLSDLNKLEEIKNSKNELDSVIGEKSKYFCWPYGGENSFDTSSINKLEKLDIKFCFSVNPKDISALDITHNKFALPRYDCNAFPHGSSPLKY